MPPDRRTEDAKVSYVVHIDEVQEVEGAYPAPFDGEKLSIYRELGRAAGSKNLGFSFERLPPGRRTSFTHAHSDEEELVYVLSGTCHLRVVEPGSEPREIPLRAGHAVSFLAGTGIAHTVVNRGDAECTLFVVGERRPGRRPLLLPRGFGVRLTSAKEPPGATLDALMKAALPALHGEVPRASRDDDLISAAGPFQVGRLEHGLAADRAEPL